MRQRQSQWPIPTSEESLTPTSEELPILRKTKRRVVQIEIDEEHDVGENPDGPISPKILSNTLLFAAPEIKKKKRKKNSAGEMHQPPVDAASSSTIAAGDPPAVILPQASQPQHLGVGVPAEAPSEALLQTSRQSVTGSQDQPSASDKSLNPTDQRSAQSTLAATVEPLPPSPSQLLLVPVVPSKPTVPSSKEAKPYQCGTTDARYLLYNFVVNEINQVSDRQMGTADLYAPISRQVEAFFNQEWKKQQKLLCKDKISSLDSAIAEAKTYREKGINQEAHFNDTIINVCLAEQKKLLTASDGVVFESKVEPVFHYAFTENINAADSLYNFIVEEVNSIFVTTSFDEEPSTLNKKLKASIDEAINNFFSFREGELRTQIVQLDQAVSDAKQYQKLKQNCLYDFNRKIILACQQKKAQLKERESLLQDAKFSHPYGLNSGSLSQHRQGVHRELHNEQKQPVIQPSVNSHSEAKELGQALEENNQSRVVSHLYRRFGLFAPVIRAVAPVGEVLATESTEVVALVVMTPFIAITLGITFAKPDDFGSYWFKDAGHGLQIVEVTAIAAGIVVGVLMAVAAAGYLGYKAKQQELLGGDEGFVSSPSAIELDNFAS